jgi:imidazolonepropionase-like amidohydrolase
MRGPAALAIAAVLFATSAAAQVTVLTNATLIDGTGAAPKPNTTIVMEHGRIASIETASAADTVPADAVRIDLTGRFVVPGIINAHGHVGPAPRDPQLRRYALYGVTTTTSMSFDDDDIAEFKAKQTAGDLRGARILTVKYRFMSEPFHPGSEYKTPEEGRAKVDEIVAKGADFIKVWIDGQDGKHPKITREFVSAVFDQARNHAHDVRDQEIPSDFLATLKERKVDVISTLAREEGMFVYGNEGAGFTDDPFFLKALTPSQREKLPEKRAAETKARNRSAMLRSFEIDKINVKKLWDGGVRLGFGTDSGGDPKRYFVQGFSEHRQMELLIQAGLTPMQVIQTFSKNNSEILGIDRDFGTLAPGKAADLLVVGADPLADITNMRKIEAVYLGGKKFE